MNRTNVFVTRLSLIYSLKAPSTRYPTVRVNFYGNLFFRRFFSFVLRNLALNPPMVYRAPIIGSFVLFSGVGTGPCGCGERARSGPTGRTYVLIDTSSFLVNNLPVTLSHNNGSDT